MRGLLAFSGRPREAGGRVQGLGPQPLARPRPPRGSRRVKVPQAEPARQADVVLAPSAVPAMTLSPAGKALRLRQGSRPARPTAASALAAPQPLRPCPEGALLGRGGDPRRGPRVLCPAAAPPRPLPERAALLTGAPAGGYRGRPAEGDRRPKPLCGRAVLAPPSCSGAWAPTARAASDAAAAAATPPPAGPAEAGAGRGGAGRAAAAAPGAAARGSRAQGPGAGRSGSCEEAARRRRGLLNGTIVTGERS